MICYQLFDWRIQVAIITHCTFKVILGIITGSDLDSFVFFFVSFSRVVAHFILFHCGS